MEDSEHIAKEKSSRFDAYLALYFPDISRSYAQQLIREGHACLNQKKVKASASVAVGMSISVYFPKDSSTTLIEENIPLSVVHEDESLLVINKPTGMVVHPAIGNWTGTVVNAIMYHCRKEIQSGVLSMGEEKRPGIVHRIDKNTSGLLLIAKTDAVQTALSKQFQSRTVKRIYLGICWGVLPPEGVWDESIGRSKKQRRKMSVQADGKNAHTTFKRIEEFTLSSFFSAQLKTGRTHQIRVHAAHHGYPLLGDSIYYNSTRAARKQAHSGLQSISRHHPELSKAIKDHESECQQLLHSSFLSFYHPIKKEKCEFSIASPKSFQSILNQLRATKQESKL